MAYKAKYKSQIVARVSEDLRARLEELAEAEEVSVGQIIREGLERAYGGDQDGVVR